jgi:hypothetical protein
MIDPVKLDYIVEHLQHYLRGNTIGRVHQRRHRNAPPTAVCECCGNSYAPHNLRSKYCGYECKAKQVLISNRKSHQRAVKRKSAVSDAH